MKGPKVLFYDIETLPMKTYTFYIGNKVSLGDQMIIQESVIACIGYKWAHEKSAKVLRFNLKKRCDKQLLKEFSKIYNEADYVVYHNGDNFDQRWVEQRVLMHNLPPLSYTVKIDTMKECKKHFRFSNYKLNYLSQRMGIGRKIDTGGFDLWRKVDSGDEDAFEAMCKYCIGDIHILEGLLNKIKPYVSRKPNMSLFRDNEHDLVCPSCGSHNIIKNGTRITSANIQQQIRCKDCMAIGYIPKGNKGTRNGR